MTILEWTGWIGAALAWLTAGFFLWRAYVSKSRQRYCPKCDYIIHEAGNLRCPECGKVARNEQQFYKGRHRRRRVLTALSFMMLGVILQAGPRIKQNGWIHSMPTTALILYADWGSSEAAFAEIRRRAFDDAVPKRVDPGRWQSDVLYEWQKTLLTRGCMNTLQPHRPRNLRLATLDLLGYRLTAANGDYTVLVSCLTDSDSVIQKKTESAIRTVWNFADEGFGARIRDQLLAIINETLSLGGALVNTRYSGASAIGLDFLVRVNLMKQKPITPFLSFTGGVEQFKLNGKTSTGTVASFGVGAAMRYQPAVDLTAEFRFRNSARDGSGTVNAPQFLLGFNFHFGK